MTTTTTRQITYVWLVLSVLTVLSWWIGPARSHGELTPSLFGTIVVLVLALVKCRLVFGYFMEVRDAPRWLRLAIDGWLVTLWLTVLALYLW